MIGRLAIPASFAALLLAGCETLDFAGGDAEPAPAAPEEPAAQCPVPGFARSGETFGGTMSWYSVRTNGGTRTASGERFADHGDTAAHRTLPFGTLVEVTNLSNEESVVLRINDRGPFKHGRVLDVSIGAAKKLGFDKQGLAQCRVEILEPVEEGAEEAALEPILAAASGEAPATPEPSAPFGLLAFAQTKRTRPEPALLDLPAGEALRDRPQAPSEDAALDAGEAE